MVPAILSVLIAVALLVGGLIHHNSLGSTLAGAGFVLWLFVGYRYYTNHRKATL